jgi:hypothetical protein
MRSDKFPVERFTDENYGPCIFDRPLPTNSTSKKDDSSCLPVVETRDSRKPFVIFNNNESRLVEGGLQDWDYQKATAVSQAGLKFLSKMDFRRDQATAVTV